MLEAESERCHMADFEGGGKDPQAKQCRQPLEDGKVKEMEPFPESPENTQSADTLILTQGNPFWASNPPEL